MDSFAAIIQVTGNQAYFSGRAVRCAPIDVRPEGSAIGMQGDNLFAVDADHLENISAARTTSVIGLAPIQAIVEKLDCVFIVME